MENQAARGSALLLGALHFLVDFTCTALLTASCVGVQGVSAVQCAILYNALAFAGQLPLGFLADRLRLKRAMAALGCLLIAAGSLFSRPFFLCCLIGTGNACFHVGGGREMLQWGKGKAAQIGRFVAPGALGIFLGPMAAAYFYLARVAAPLLLAVGAALLLRQRNREDILQPPALPPVRLLGICVCMFLTVLLRSYMGTVTRYGTLSVPLFALSMTLCVFAGKFFGGSLADRFGALRFSRIAQPVGTALFVLSVWQPLLALPATLLFNTTMAITAATLYRCVPALGGTMFGLTTLALYLGVLPRLLGLPNALFTWWGLGLIGLASTALLLLGLRLAKTEENCRAC